MNNQQKTIAFWSALAFFAILAIFLLVSIQHMRDTAPTTNQVSFNGEGKVSAKPDVAIANFSIITNATTSKAAQDANSARSKKVFDFLKKQNVDEKDIKTTYYNINPQYATPQPYSIRSYSVEPQMSPDYYPAPVPADNPKITGYQVAQGYEVKVRDLDKASMVIDGLVAAGANEVSNVRFDFEDRDKVIAEARGKAIADAKSKAKQLQSQIGIKLGKIVNYYDNSTGYYPYAYDKAYAAGMGGGGEASGPVLPPGENEITIGVTITYQIK